MAKKNNTKATKEPKKTLATATAKPVETKKEEKKEEKPAVKPEEKPKATVQDPPKAEEKPVDKNPEPIVPEVVDPKEEEKKEEDKVPSISAGLNKIANGDRIDHNHAIDLMKMVHTEYVGNPDTPEHLRSAMKTQFDAMTLVELMFYNSQLANDFQQLGVKVKESMFIEMEKVAREVFGISLKGLPDPKNDKQMIINFDESMPKDLKETVAKDQKASKLEIPEPDINMSEADKLTVLRTILSQIGSGIGSNITNSIEWSRKAFGFQDDEKKAVILANILSHDFRTTLTKAITEMSYGKLSKDHTVLGVHALLKKWLPTYSDEEVAELVNVCIAYKAQANIKDYKNNTDQNVDLDKELALLTDYVTCGCDATILKGIEDNAESVVTDYKAHNMKFAVNTKSIRNLLAITYGNSDSILKEKIQQIAKCYANPIKRLSNYVDKSAYNA